MHRAALGRALDATSERSRLLDRSDPWLWLRRGLEAAIGFHFAVDLARYTAAYLALHGPWSG